MHFPCQGIVHHEISQVSRDDSFAVMQIVASGGGKELSPRTSKTLLLSVPELYHSGRLPSKVLVFYHMSI